MNAQKTRNVWRYWLILVVLCIWSMPRMAAAAAPIPQIPTGPKDMFGNWATPDYYTTANWANSPPLPKFVDTLPGLGSSKKNNLNQYLPVAVPDTTTYPGSDYYIIELRQYTQKMHSDLNPTTLRGYVQVNAAGQDVAPINYLGPVIVADRDRPVRILFRNKLPTGEGGNLFIPTDTSVMGAGTGPADSAGNPCDNTPLNNPNGCASYTQNRAAIHLHGGRTPWISDGTPHQWITPAGENTPFKQGVSLQNVPDMPAPGPGETTYYFTNQQSARLMFYHDHAFGITRLNVYAGEAAGYVITDNYEKDLINRGILPPDQVPLIIQDKTFVDATPVTHPVTGQPTTQVRVTDPLWNWGSGPVSNGIKEPVTGDLWLPHVYMPAQSTLAGSGGVNPFGRWMYGPWFYPPTAIEVGPKPNPYYDPNCSSSNPFLLAECQTPGQPEQIPGTPNLSMGMEAFQDSAVVNGTVFPSLTVDPRAYRFRLLNAASDRFFNLSFYVADSTPGNISPEPRLMAAGKSNLTEVKMVPASAELAAANNWPADWPVDGRDGGVPDPGLCQAGGVNCPNLGPSFLQFASEGGFLPKPVVINPQPITYITDPTAFWVGNVDKMGLALGPAERADVVVDFSAYAGKTLILYNDAPAAWPARVPGYDYYTGAPDMRDSGGYGAGGVIDPATGAWVVDPANPANAPHGVLPGYAPNTRTVLQIIVRPAGSTVDGSYSFNQAALEAEFTPNAPVTALNPAPAQTLFERSQEPIIVGQAAYASAYPNSFFPANYPWEGINQINDHFLDFVTLTGDHVRAITEPKGIHDEMGASFDPIYGRMSGNLAMQLPNPTTLNANLILYGFSDVPTETVHNSVQYNVTVVPGTLLASDGTPLSTLADGTQIWKISHNGVDTHPIHFHIFDVQLINRVGWDGQILFPEPNELGWKDTVKISPLEDTIVAVRPRAPALPFGIPESLRPLNPSIPINSTMGFNSIDPLTGQAYRAPSPYAGGVTNTIHNFGWEYVWHCHILSHEEMDMMRPIVLLYDAALPPAFAASKTVVSNRSVVTWNDPTPVSSPLSALPDLYRNPANEIGFKVYRSAADGSFARDTNGNPIPVATLLANTTSFTDSANFNSRTYVVEAYTAKGSTFAFAGNSFTVALTATNGPAFTYPGPVNLEATISGKPNGVTITSVQFYDGATLIGTALTAPYTFVWNNAAVGTHSVTAKVNHDFGAGSIVSSALPVMINGTIAANFIPNNGATVNACASFVSTSTGAGITGYSWLINGVTYNTPTVNPILPAGTYPVTLGIVKGSTGEVAQITKTITVTNNNPTAITGGPYTIYPGGTLLLNGSATDPDACHTTFNYAWNMDNVGPYDFFTANPSISYNALKTVLGVGTHTITLQVTDPAGGTGTATTTLTIYGNPPTVTMTGPANGSTYAAPASITLTATAAATDPGATITGVDFYNGATKIGSGVLSGGVYSFTWTATTGGQHNLKARATDSFGSMADSTAVLVNVSGISTSSLSTGWVNYPFSQTMAFYGGTAPFTWSATGLPAGLTIDPATGIISGTPGPSTVTAPATSATFPVSISVQDSSATPLTGNVVLTLVINQTGPAAPTGLTATSPVPNQILLSWTDNANNETGFEIQRATDNTFTTGVTTVTLSTVNLAAYTDTTVVAGTTYYYRVRSFNIVSPSVMYSNTVSVALPVITTASLPNGGVNAAYSTTVTASGGTAPYTWSATGLPAGLSINPASGVISGTPLPSTVPTGAFATFPVTITVQDSLAVSVTTSLIFRINQTAPAAPSGLTANATSPTQVVVNWTDNANNESGVQVQRATNATFTAGLTSVTIYGTALTSYTDNTVVSGTTYYYRVRSGNYVAWSTAFSNTATTTTPVPISIVTASLPNGAVNTAYSQTISASGGVAPYAWSATGLPTGLSIDPATGIISGTPAPNTIPAGAFATFPVSITVQDSLTTPLTANTVLNLRINQTAPAAPSGLSANATSPTQVVVNWTDNANNESGVQVQRATNATFTAGLTSVIINGTALTAYTDNTVVSGTTYYYRVRSGNYVAWSTSFSNTATVTTPVPISIVTASLPNGAVNAAYSQTISASGGVAPYTWSATGLPAGLSINSSTGVISGVPTAAIALGYFTFPVSITVQDSLATPLTANTVLNLRINQTAPVAPSGLTANATSPTQVVVNWTDNANNESGVQVQRASNATFTAGLTSAIVNGTALTAYTDNTVVSGTTYYYRVRSGNYVAWSTAFSNTATVTTP